MCLAWLRKTNYVFCFLLIALAASAQVAAQVQPSSAIRLPITAVHPDGSCVSLSPQSLRVVDNGNPQTIDSLQPADQLPRRFVIVADTSSSMKSHESLLRESVQAAAGLVSQLLRSDADRAALMTVNRELNLDMRLTSDAQQLREVGARVQVRGDVSKIFDGVAAAAAYAGENSGTRYRLILILITAGDDNASQLSFNEALQLASYWGATIHAVALPTGTGSFPPTVEIPTAQTASFMFKAADTTEIPLLYDSLRRALTCGYVVQYRPADLEPGSLHSLQVSMPSDPEARLFTALAYQVPSKEPEKGTH